MKQFAVLAAALCVAFADAPASAQQIYEKEPAKGTMRYGEKILVDNGECPKGQIQEVTGGTSPGRHARHGRGMDRERRCISHP